MSGVTETTLSMPHDVFSCETAQARLIGELNRRPTRTAASSSARFRDPYSRSRETQRRTRFGQPARRVQRTFGFEVSSHGFGF